MEVEETVDRAGPDWLGRVGIVTQLFDRATWDGRERRRVHLRPRTDDAGDRRTSASRGVGARPDLGHPRAEHVVRRRLVRALPARAVLRLPGRPGLQPCRARTGIQNGRAVMSAVAPPRRVQRRPRVGVVKFASCDGCQLTLLDLEDDLLAIAERFDIVEFPEATSRRSVRPVRRPPRRGIDQHRRAARGAVPPPPRDDDPRDDRCLRDGRRHPGDPELVRPRPVGGDGLSTPRARRLAGDGDPGVRPRRRRRRAPWLPDRSGPASRAADGARRRAATATAR